MGENKENTFPVFFNFLNTESSFNDQFWMILTWLFEWVFILHPVFKVQTN